MIFVIIDYEKLFYNMVAVFNWLAAGIIIICRGKNEGYPVTDIFRLIYEQLPINSCQ